MQPAQESSKPEPSASTLGETLRKKSIELVVMALPTFIVGKVVPKLTERFTSQPWQVLWVVLPLAVLSYVVWKAIADRERLKSEKSFVVLTSCYLLIFFILAGSGFLNLWERSLVGYEGTAPRNFFALNWAGDWRYFFARQKPAGHDFIVVILEPAQTKVEGRYDISRLIKLAVANQAKGIAFDFYFNGDSEPGFDQLMCTEIKNAEKSKIPVFVGFGFHFTHEEPIRDEIARNLQLCLPDSNQGHLLGYAEWDGKIRMVPLYFKNDRSKEALSLRIARSMDSDGKLNPPEDGLLQFIKPENDINEITYDELIGNPQERGRLRDKFVLVGERSETDTFLTPYKRRPGVVIHAFAVHSLRQNHFIQRAPWWSGFLMIFVSCYLIMILFTQRVRNPKIALVGVLASVIIFVSSAAAMYFWLAWVDIVYPIAAIWLLLPLLIGLQRIRRRKTQEPAPQPDPEPDTVSPAGANSRN
jgi:CHASE2 domain-containing sensor protein